MHARTRPMCGRVCDFRIGMRDGCGGVVHFLLAPYVHQRNATTFLFFCFPLPLFSPRAHISRRDFFAATRPRNPRFSRKIPSRGGVHEFRMLFFSRVCFSFSIDTLPARVVSNAKSNSIIKVYLKNITDNCEYFSKLKSIINTLFHQTSVIFKIYFFFYMYIKLHKNK